MTELLGTVMLAAPFVLLAVLIIRTDGWGCFFFVFGGSAALVLWVQMACNLIGGTK